MCSSTAVAGVEGPPCSRTPTALAAGDETADPAASRGGDAP